MSPTSMFTLTGVAGEDLSEAVSHTAPRVTGYFLDIGDASQIQSHRCYPRKVGLPDTLPVPVVHTPRPPLVNVIRKSEHQAVIAPTAATFGTEISVEQVNVEGSRASMRLAGRGRR